MEVYGNYWFIEPILCRLTAISNSLHGSITFWMHELYSQFYQEDFGDKGYWLNT